MKDRGKKSCLLVSPPDPPAGRILRSYSGGNGDLVGADDGILLPPMELVTLATRLQRDGWLVTVIDCAIGNFERLRAALTERRYDAVVSSVALASRSSDCAFAGKLRKLLTPKVLVLNTRIFDYDLMSATKLECGADGVLFPGDAAHASNLLNSFLMNGDNTMSERARHDNRNFPLDDVLPDRSLLLHQSNYKFAPLVKLDQRLGPATTIQTSYGCPYSCSYYCPYPANEGRRIRAHSAARVIDEFEAIAALAIPHVVVRDPLFTYSRRRTLEICRGLEARSLGVSWWCETRIDRTDPVVLDALRRAGCLGLEVGVESGDGERMARIGKKGLTPERVIEFNRQAQDAGIAPIYLFVLGLPGETRKSIRATLEFICLLDCASSQINFSVVTPYPGTPLYEEAVKRGWIERALDKFGGYSPVMHTDDLSVEDLDEALGLIADLRVATGPGHSQSEQINFIERVAAWST